jgi:hypothetical protein
MNHRFWLLVAAVGLVLAASPAVTYAQEALVANVPFPFIAAGRTHDAGEYRLAVSENKEELTLTPMKGPATIALVQSRLAVINSPEQADRVVFDKVGNTYYLSELWLPGQDGFLMYAAKEAHTHHMVKIGRKSK